MFLGDNPRDVLVFFVGVRVTIRSLQGARGEQPGHHEEGADEQRGTAAEAVEVEDCGEGHGDVDDVLDGSGEEFVSDARAAHDEDDVVHHDVHAAQLRPHLDGHAENNALEDAGLDEGGEAGGGFFALEAKCFFDFLVLGEDFGVAHLSVAVEVGEDLEGFFPAVFGG